MFGCSDSGSGAFWLQFVGSYWDFGVIMMGFWALGMGTWGVLL